MRRQGKVSNYFYFVETQKRKLKDFEQFGFEDEEEHKEIEDNEEPMPFMLFKVNKVEKYYENKIGSIVRFDHIHFGVREFFVNVSNYNYYNIIILLL